MQAKRIAVTAATIVASLVSVSSALARPTIDVNKAESAMRIEADKYVAEYNSDADDYNAALADTDADELAARGWEADSKIVKWSVDGCDQETSYRALCDWSVVFANGAEDEYTDDLVVTRKGRYVLR